MESAGISQTALTELILNTSECEKSTQREIEIITHRVLEVKVFVAVYELN